jgi:hypothetical protein
MSVKAMTGDQMAIALGVFSLLVAIVAATAAMNSASAASRSATTAEEQLALVTRKIGMVTEPQKMTEVLPVWYIDRMANDNWGFGLLLNFGSILAIERIEGVSDDGQWLEVSLLAQDGRPDQFNGHKVLYRIAGDRSSASVRVDQIQAAFEIETS